MITPKSTAQIDKEPAMQWPPNQLPRRQWQPQHLHTVSRGHLGEEWCRVSAQVNESPVEEQPVGQTQPREEKGHAKVGREKKIQGETGT